jgi:uncharacterized protein (TIGR02001 family)
MKKILKSSLSLAMAALMSLSMFAHAGEAVADDHASSVSYNVGYMSEYWYRGVYQSESAVSFGADAEMGNFYIGTWWADVDSGVEYDIYAGFNFEMMGLPMYLGATGYYYSDNFDGDYEEMNVGVDLGFAAIDYAFAGTYEPLDGSADQDYEHFTITMPLMVVPLDFSYGTFQDELTGHYYELSYGATVSGVDVGVVLGRNSDDSTVANDAAGNPITSDADTTYAVFTLGYSF